MKVKVLEHTCQGHTLCAGSAPEVFILREVDGHAFVENEIVSPELEEKVRRAQLGCPERAIVVSEDD
ncbi:MAG: ferredoxin [Chloroflexi bacterium]|nr:ferredoxin [Chloroflexota bacterium]|tara:strand:+ start:6685 stop:6885 length:201 start_codon:yes stop_codon:yes gene_type:complete